LRFGDEFILNESHCKERKVIANEVSLILALNRISYGDIMMKFERRLISAVDKLLL
jgi:hypothetical protein